MPIARDEYVMEFVCDVCGTVRKMTEPSRGDCFVKIIDRGSGWRIYAKRVVCPGCVSLEDDRLVSVGYRDAT